MKKVALVIVFLHLGLSLFAGWRSQVIDLYERKEGHEPVFLYLEKQYLHVPEFDKPLCCLLLSYTSHKTSRLNRQKFWTREFFETHGAVHTSLEFLPAYVAGELSNYEKSINKEYPLIMGFGLKDGGLGEDEDSPREMVLILEMNNPAYYKITQPDGEIFKGGALQEGRNYIRFKSPMPLEREWNRRFVLSLKSRELVLEKSLELGVRLSPMAEPGIPEAEGDGDPDIYTGEVHHVNVSARVDDRVLLSQPGAQSMIDGSYPTLIAGMPVMPALGYLFKKIFSRKKKKASRVSFPHTFKIQFMQPDGQGLGKAMEGEVKVEISD